MTITPAGHHRLVEQIAAELDELGKLGGSGPDTDGVLGLCCRRTRVDALITAATLTLDPAERRNLEAVLRDRTVAAGWERTTTALPATGEGAV
jgi:hypothetical protein